MRATELRIGNLIYLKSKDKIYEISSGHDIEEIDDAPENFDAKPIQLTEEWLLKFGFVSNPYKDRYELIAKINIIIECDKTKGLVDLYCEQFPHIKYVHSLQNLYFALTGEELTLKS
jgi:hypothetical protein